MSETKATRPRGIRMDDVLHQAIKVRAAQLGETIEQFVDRACRLELERTKEGVK